MVFEGICSLNSLQLTFKRKKEIIKMKRNGLGFYGSAGMLTETQELVYEHYCKQRIVSRGVSDDTQRGSWEHLSCKYKEGTIDSVPHLLSCIDVFK